MFFSFVQSGHRIPIDRASPCVPLSRYMGKTARRIQKGHDNSVVSCLSCPNSMVLVLTSKAGGCRLFSGLLYWKNPACPAVELCTKRVNRKYEVVITNSFRKFVRISRAYHTQNAMSIPNSKIFSIINLAQIKTEAIGIAQLF